MDVFQSQLSICTPLLLSHALLHKRPQKEAGPFWPSKQSRIEQRWHINLQQDARALVILLQIACVEPDTRDVTFGGILKA